jgi:rhamnosyltransferase
MGPSIPSISDELLAINSGSLFILENVKLLGWHNDGYFVDGVDYAFCLKAAKKGLKIGRCHKPIPGFDHTTEQADHDLLFFGRTLRIRRYPMERIGDVVFSNIKLIAKSLYWKKFNYTIRFFRLLVIYLLYQSLARFEFLLGYNNNRSVDEP